MGRVVVCVWPSEACRLAEWEVTYFRGEYRLNWIRGFAYPRRRITKSTIISERTAQAHYRHAVKLGRPKADWHKHPPWRKP